MEGGLVGAEGGLEDKGASRLQSLELPMGATCGVCMCVVIWSLSMLCPLRVQHLVQLAT